MTRAEYVSYSVGSNGCLPVVSREGMKDMKDLETLLFATHTGMTGDEFHTIVQEWLGRAKDTRWNRPYTELIYQPMLEVMRYLRANGYKTYIVTGGVRGIRPRLFRARFRHSTGAGGWLGARNSVHLRCRLRELELANTVGARRCRIAIQFADERSSGLRHSNRRRHQNLSVSHFVAVEFFIPILGRPQGCSFD